MEITFDFDFEENQLKGTIGYIEPKDFGHVKDVMDREPDCYIYKIGHYFINTDNHFIMFEKYNVSDYEAFVKTLKNKLLGYNEHPNPYHINAMVEKANVPFVFEQLYDDMVLLEGVYCDRSYLEIKPNSFKTNYEEEIGVELVNLILKIQKELKN